MNGKELKSFSDIFLFLPKCHTQTLGEILGEMTNF